MSENIAEKFQRWDREGHSTISGETFDSIHHRLTFFNDIHYHQYLPTFGPEFPDYEERLRVWINQRADEEQQRLLAELAPKIIFFGQNEFSKMHQAALKGPIYRWIIDTESIKLTASNFQTQLDDEVNRHTWYIGLTDSAKINEFHTVNGLGGIDLRPDCRSLVKFSDRQRVREFMENHKDAGKKSSPLKRIVVIEDFVGSGTQTGDFLTKLASFCEPAPVLFVPEIICPKGLEAIRAKISGQSTIQMQPVLELEASIFITRSAVFDTGSFESRLRDFATHIHPDVFVGDPLVYDPLGFPASEPTGAIIVLYSNTPNNTIPVVRHKSAKWSPLFPRSARLR